MQNKACSRLIAGFSVNTFLRRDGIVQPVELCWVEWLTGCWYVYYRKYIHLYSPYAVAARAFVPPGQTLRLPPLPSPPFLFPPPSSRPILSLRSMPLLIQLRGLGERFKLPQWGLVAKPQPTNDLVHIWAKN